LPEISFYFLFCNSRRNFSKTALALKNFKAHFAIAKFKIITTKNRKDKFISPVKRFYDLSNIAAKILR